MIAQGISHGKQLYCNLWNNKPPGIVYIYTLIVKIFGLAMWSIGTAEVVL